MASSYPKQVRIVEVGPRDGLQNEKTIIPTEAKLRFIGLLNEAGLPVIEVTSFVSPKAIPQLADASAVFPAIEKKPGTAYPVLVPNQRGMERALAAGVREVAVFTAASESFTRANINMTIAESIAAFRPVVAMAQANQMRVRGYISTAFGCPYEGRVAPKQVVAVAQQLLDLGVDELSIGDTIGVATPNQVSEIVPLLAQQAGLARLAMHFHDTRGTALANVLAALQAGITTFDSAAGGAGGCPYAPGAAGNLATEDLLYMLHGMGIATGVDLAAVVRASLYLRTLLSRPLTSKYLQAAIATQE
jgi:isopropylmalate/homocitrate/citramalate synthase